MHVGQSDHVADTTLPEVVRAMMSWARCQSVHVSWAGSVERRGQARLSRTRHGPHAHLAWLHQHHAGPHSALLPAYYYS